MRRKNTGKREKSYFWTELLGKIRSLPFFPGFHEKSEKSGDLLAEIRSLPFFPGIGELDEERERQELLSGCYGFCRGNVK